jgi:hypothetical protein
MLIRGLAHALAINRTLFGLGYVVAPDRTGANWVGKVAEDEGTQVLTRALGARDFVLGIGAVRALATRRDVRDWFAAHAVADTTDLVATLVAKDRLPKRSFAFATAMSAGSAAIAIAATLAPPQ